MSALTLQDMSNREREAIEHEHACLPTLDDSAVMDGANDLGGLDPAGPVSPWLGRVIEYTALGTLAVVGLYGALVALGVL